MKKARRCLILLIGFELLVSLPSTQSFSPQASAYGSSSTGWPDVSVAVTELDSSDQGNDAPLIEEFSFLIKDLKVDLQSGMQNLNITVRYSYVRNIAESEYPDFLLIQDDIKNFLARYPNKSDYWEIINKKLTHAILKKFTTLSKITIEIQVSPTPGEPYLRSSIVTRSRTSADRQPSRRGPRKT